MTKEEKLEVIKNAAEDAAEKVAEALQILITAEKETGYSYSFQILQELEEQNRGTVAYDINQIANGSKDEDITSELNEDA